MSNILINNNFYISTSSACVVDLTPPTFAGINFLDVESRGQIRAGWSTATDATLPIRYEVYIQASSSIGLFNVANIIASTPNLQYDIFSLPDGSFLVNGTTYYVGVRAVDALSNRNTNVVSMSIISTGVLTSIDVYSSEISHSVDENDGFNLSIWGIKNQALAVSPDAVLGTASYQIYDKLGVAVSGMSGSGVSANAQGLYIFPSVPSLIDRRLQNYSVKTSITIDGEARLNFLPLSQSLPIYEIAGAFTINRSNNLIGSFWAMSDGDKIDNVTRLGTGSYDIYDAAGAIVSGLSQSGISPTADGQFVIIPIASTLQLDSTVYYVKVKLDIDGQEKEHIIPLTFEVPEYEVKAQFSINALNQLLATFWITANGQVKTSSLGAANYTVYDAAGVAVAGLTQSGLTADGNGRYAITPVLATPLTDLTHYSVKIGIVCDAVERIGYKGFTLLGT